MKKYLVFSLVFLTPLFALAESFDRDLQFGMQNNSDVTKLQELLTDEGLYFGPISGNFFSLTQKAVKNFQTREGIKPASGYFGLKTRTRVNAIFSVSVSASKDQVSIKNVVSPVSIVSTMPVKIEDNKSDAVILIMDQIAQLQKQIDSLLKKTTPTSPAQTATISSQTPVVAQIIEEPVKQKSTLSSIDQSSSVNVSATPVQLSPAIPSSSQSTSVQATGEPTSSATISTQTSGGLFRAIGSNGEESYGMGGTLQSH
ncbi:MAG: peptidoglycan-binding protein [Candidatus Sungbacteria bacterium]|uniref:Peptidoglycan-binding protein n=1 Tax=Candidatus Sungiibacteriota bacterium TaxID=2750080 RepID=A0A931YDP8_9BACT|nr:peptidoglycan-binding protein [Candidatus Sungbacteria bacterium]MBI2465993.1 peptidoglycan-binding protein [Candidatus Sungbacteria bacterium]